MNHLVTSCFVLLVFAISWAESSSLNRHSRYHPRVFGRHRRVPEPEAIVLGADLFRNSEKQAQNRHKPILQCGEGQREVEEESPRGTLVLQVLANDKDGPDHPSGQITYSIVSTHNKFTIDPNTGWLKTNAIFNRDEPDREKLVHVTVKASDNGRPQLEDVCTLSIKVTDKNDNSPVFDRANYNYPIAQDAQIGTTIMRVSATDVDEGKNQEVEYHLAAVNNANEIDYFEWNFATGVVLLKRKLDKPVGHNFILQATAQDKGTPPKSTSIDITLEVRESNNKPPAFKDGPGAVITLEEDYNEFSKPIAYYKAVSNIPGDDTVFFQLVNGRTEKTNKDGTFRAIPNQDDPTSVSIYLAKGLVYEKVNEYTLTLQVRNSPDLVAEAQLTVKILDKNNQAPIFTNVESGNVLEHEPEGTFVMQVSAVDNDGQYPNNRVTYVISPNNPKSIREKFDINEDTGVITTKKEFDREEEDVYAVIVDAVDGAPSSLLLDGRPNRTPNTFRIAIADKNDNPPYFPQQQYKAEVPENQDVGSKVIEVRADDLDTEASVTTYQILKGNMNGAFKIEDQTGFIRVAKHLDYEETKKYNLVVGAWDGQYGNETHVEINVLNENDLAPVFSKDMYWAKEMEEEVPNYPILRVSAIDQDIEDPSAEQNIIYSLDSGSQLSSHFTIDEHTGDLRIVKKLDRDQPFGYPTWSMFIFAKDENGSPTGNENFVEFKIDLIDINDNPPFLDMPGGLVWPENSRPGAVGVLVADDYDTPENGAPFKFEIDKNADPNIKAWFDITPPAPNGSYILRARTRFDREKRKEHKIPIRICDRKDLCDVSILKLVIGDENDNPMESGGFSEIFVYNYLGLAPETEIGRVYVKDPDDWDLPNKTFKFKEAWKWQNFFRLDRNTGMISMRENIDFEGKEQRTFSVEFIVEDPTHNQVGSNAVSAVVNITIQKISKEAVQKSGSIRITGPPEDFIRPDFNGFSNKDKFVVEMKQILNATHFDVFTVLPAEGGKSTDIRFSAHGSPYYAPEKMEGALARRKSALEHLLNIEVTMVHIDECLYEDQGPCQDKMSCSNQLEIDDQPVTVYTNMTSFVGVQARVVPFCGCAPSLPKVRSCDPNPCLNDGVCRPLVNGKYSCQCPADNSEYFGPNCEILAASFNGQGWSLHQSLPACGNSHLSLVFTTQSETGTLLYVGPTPNTVVDNVADFLLVEVVDGRIKMYINFGSETHVLALKQKVNDNNNHELALRWTNDTVQMDLDDKTCSNDVSQPLHNCYVHTTHHGPNSYLNTNGPLQVGGISFGTDDFRTLAPKLKINSDDAPHGEGFAGCIKNLTFYAVERATLYDLGSPADGENFTPGCDEEFVMAITAMNINLNFLIAILVCLTAILVVVIVLAVYRRKKSVFSDKDIDCDIRENIINYEDEGGGEGDQTGYDLSVLRMMSNGTPVLHSGDQKFAKIPLQGQMDQAPDIQTFLQTNKDRIDGDPDATPFDDLRYYAYEGDGLSGRSLSSLNSGTSDADLEFDYLHNFGPRFKKLADMYGEEPDSDSEDEETSSRHISHPEYTRHPSSSQQPSFPSTGLSSAPSESWC